MTEVEQTKTCAICCDEFNNSTRKPIRCAYCQGNACLSCVKQYVMMKDDPVCTMCDHPWNRDFIDSVLPKAFRDKDLKQKREDVLLERELSQMPATQGLAQAELRRRETVKQCELLKAEKKSLTERLYLINTQINRYEDRAWRLRNMVLGLEPLVDDDTQLVGPGVQQRRQFIKHCPVDECTGYLSTQYKCGMCSTRVCSTCHAIKHENHQCNPDDVASATLISAECKSCPKCASLVYKIDGCDQMWCTQCHTAFSWASGRIETGRIHNPHWYDWQRFMNNGDIPREPRDIPGGACCGDGINVVPSLFSIPLSKRTVSWVSNVHRLLTHISLHTMTRFMGAYNQNDNMDLRISYLLKEIDDNKLKKILQQREKRRAKESTLRGILEFFVAAGSELIRQLADIRTDPIAIYPMMLELRTMANKAFTDASKRFSCKEYIIDAAWTVNDNSMA